MPKMKSKSAAKKRFKVTGSGKVKREKSFASHLLEKKTAKRRRKLHQATLVNDTQEKNVKRMLVGNY